MSSCFPDCLPTEAEAEVMIEEHKNKPLKILITGRKKIVFMPDGHFYGEE